MLPSDLKPEQFNGYPPEARKLVTGYVETLQRLPLSFVPSLLREVIDYDFKFPPERKAIEKELANLKSLSPEQVKEWFQGFAQIKQTPKLESVDWVNSPGLFVEQLSAHLWATHQLDAFRKAAMDYASRLQAVAPPEPPPVPRLGIAVIGQGATAHDEPLFRKLRAHGGYFSRVNPENGLETLLNAVAARAKAHPAPYAHWYIDGGQEARSRSCAHLCLLQCSGTRAGGPVAQDARGDRKTRHGTGGAAHAAGADASRGSWHGRRQKTRCSIASRSSC